MKGHNLVHLILASRSGANEPKIILLLTEPLKSACPACGVAVTLEEYRVSVAQMHKVNEDGAGRGRGSVG